MLPKPNNTLSVLNALSGSISAMIKSFKTRGFVLNAEAALVEQQIRLVKSVFMAKAMGEITRTSILEIEKTFCCIQQRKSSECPLAEYMSLLEIQNEGLQTILRAFAAG